MSSSEDDPFNCFVCEELALDAFCCSVEKCLTLMCGVHSQKCNLKCPNCQKEGSLQPNIVVRKMIGK